MRLKRKTYRLFSWVILALGLFIQSCSTVDCPDSRKIIRSGAPKPAKWNVELRTPVQDKFTSSKQTLSIRTDSKPVYVPLLPQRYSDCDQFQNILNANYHKNFVRDSSGEFENGKFLVFSVDDKEGSSPYEIEAGNVRNITSTADPLQPPKVFMPDVPCPRCLRFRNGCWIFDKLELRATVGYRGSINTLVYPTPTGSITYQPQNPLSFAINGSSLLVGFEIVPMLSLPFIDKTERFQLGFMTGIIPTDGSLFIPLTIHPRYTFNQFPDPFIDNCSSLYVFADVGIPFDFSSKAPVPGSRYFYGLGIGYDMPINCKTDFSLDIGYRAMNLPLEQIICCPNIPDDEKNPYRLSRYLFLQAGLTF